MGGVNDDEIAALAAMTERYPLDLRFIELMPMTVCEDFGAEAYISCDAVIKALPEMRETREHSEGVARLYRLPGAKGSIGLISPVSSHFCAECNRIRLTADGKLKPCLHSGDEYSLKGLDTEGMRSVLRDVIWNKPRWHGEMDAEHRSQSGRNMNEIGG